MAIDSARRAGSMRGWRDGDGPDRRSRRRELFDLASLLGVALAGPDADAALDAMYRVVMEIRERAELLQKACAGI
jgi:hypothetical protein